jgi:hypothetical protein
LLPPVATTVFVPLSMIVAPWSPLSTWLFEDTIVSGEEVTLMT